MAQTLERDDVQGLVIRGYGRLLAAAYVLGQIVDGAATRTWLGRLGSEIANGGRHDGETALHVAFTADGLRSLGLAPVVLAGFSEPFLDGMTTEHRQRMLGDTDESAPEHWDWGAPGGVPVHVLLLVYARNESALRGALRTQEAALQAGGIRVVRILETTRLDDREHFGFRDGVSQPRLEGLGPASALHGVTLGEFLLGYRNEYGRFTPRPLVPGTDDPHGLLADDVEGSGQRDLGRNGTYLVFRQLSQDVHGFWQFCESRTRRLGGAVDEAARMRLAAKLVGRWPSGASLVRAPYRDRPEVRDENDFNYFHQDPHGFACPLGAHVRRANPRDSLDPAPGTARSIAVNKRHRLVRRGRKYGTLLPRDALLTAGVDDAWRNEARGLHFICLAGNIGRQFEFVQHTWLNNPSFAGLYDDPDPLLSPAPPTGRVFTVQAEPVRERHVGLPRFVGVRGGAYFFLPGARALRYLASLSGDNDGR